MNHEEVSDSSRTFAVRNGCASGRGPRELHDTLLQRLVVALLQGDSHDRRHKQCLG
jgi:hypothetical protein